MYHECESLRLNDSKLSLDADQASSDPAEMITQPYHLYVERIDATRNMARYYALSIQPTLFGKPSLLRCWGRIGTRGQQKIHLFEDERQAVGLFLELALQKRKRGYRPRTICGNRAKTTRVSALPQ